MQRKRLRQGFRGVYVVVGGLPLHALSPQREGGYNNVKMGYEQS